MCSCVCLPRLPGILLASERGHSSIHAAFIFSQGFINGLIFELIGTSSLFLCNSVFDTAKSRTALLLGMANLVHMHLALRTSRHKHSSESTDETHAIRYITHWLVQRPSSLANLTVLTPVDVRDHRPRPGDVADVPSPHVQRQPEDENYGGDAGHRAIGIEVPGLLDPRVRIE